MPVPVACRSKRIGRRQGRPPIFPATALLRTVLACLSVVGVRSACAAAPACPADGGGLRLPLCIPAGNASTRLDRRPTAQDDSRAGYAEGDLWQAQGQVWRAASVQAGAARWVGLKTGRPGDAFGAHTVFAGGPMQMVTGYAGPVLDLAVLVSGQRRTRTIAVRPDGTFDGGALDAALAERDPGTDAIVLRIYDQSGHGNHLTAIPGREVAHIGAIRIAGHETISWGEDNGPGGFVIPDSLTVPANGFFFGTTGMYASSNTASGAYPVPVLLGGRKGGRAFKLFTGSYTLDGFVHLADPNSPDQKTGLVVTNSPAAFGVTAEPGGYDLMSGNAISSYRSAVPAGTLAGGYVGYNADGGSWYSQGRNTGQWTGIVIADGGISDGSLRDFRASAAAVGNFMPQLKSVLIAIGDSRTEGYQVQDGLNWPVLMQRKARYQSYNFSVSGATTRQMRAALPAADALARRASTRVAVIFGGFNDQLETNHIPVAETIATLGMIVKNLKTYGFTVAIVDEANTDGAPRQPIQDAVRTGAIPADVEVDPFAAGQPLYSVENRTYWQDDDTHPTALGQAFLAEAIWAKVGPRLAPAPPGPETRR
ncbi:SGNH/GDSL hydrolase family protein [Gluconacetobacter tumulisoli]|uniref:SGNH/GDSL hydrolase family protein n=1 Tax=Gluconacetobacter tumulisoli TaxID=1286189 RepID=A0A7W4PP91_9PROT|nr:SGNH/GDSL hydrolase family protein [Gluconacetobacter tumulisoli]MBB2201566.1 SGNH/GDSL hydrolase family protein [Gluconacetobacter tumulisoli]